MSAPDLYADALAIVREKGFVSVSMIQRCLRIGYSAAQDLAEQMMSRGDVDELPRPPALNVPRVRGNTNNEKSTADMQPAPATEQATIAQAFARDYPKPTATHTQRHFSDEDCATLQRIASCILAGAPPSQNDADFLSSLAGRTQNVDLGLAKLTCEQLRARLEQADDHIARLEAERVQSSESIGKDKEFLRLLVAHQYAEQAFQDEGSDVKRALVDDTWEAFIGYIDARSATASKAEASDVTEAVRNAGAAMASTMRNLAQHTRRADLAACYKAMQVEWDRAIAATTKQGTP